MGKMIDMCPDSDSDLNLAIRDDRILKAALSVDPSLTRRDWCFRIGSMLSIKLPLLSVDQFSELEITEEALALQLDGKQCLPYESLIVLVESLGHTNIEDFLREALRLIPKDEQALKEKLEQYT